MNSRSAKNRNGRAPATNHAQPNAAARTVGDERSRGARHSAPAVAEARAAATPIPRGENAQPTTGPGISTWAGPAASVFEKLARCAASRGTTEAERSYVNPVGAPPSWWRAAVNKAAQVAAATS